MGKKGVLWRIRQSFWRSGKRSEYIGRRKFLLESPARGWNFARTMRKNAQRFFYGKKKVKIASFNLTKKIKAI